MRVLSRYVCREFLRFFWLGLAGCVGFFSLVEFFDRIDKFVERRVFWGDAVRYLALRVPGIAYQVVPAVFLLASILTFSTMNRGNEIIAIRAAGMAPLRFACPLLLIGAVGGMGLLVAQEYVVPYTNQMAHLLWRTRIRREKIAMRLGAFKRGRIWYRAANRIWSVQLSNPLGQRLLGVAIFILDTTGTIRQRYDAAEAQWDRRGWTLRRGSMRVFKADGTFDGLPERFALRRLRVPEQFADISAIRKQPEEMSNREVLAYARQLQRQGVSDTQYLTEFYGRFAFAAACIIMASFGLPLALQLNRRGGAVRAIGLTLLSGFGYWVAYSVTMALGYNGQLPPIVAAWSANVCFGAGTVYLSCRLQ